MLLATMDGLGSAAMSLGLAYLPVAAVPGPNFVIVSRAGLASSRTGALRAAIGVSLGAALIAAIAASGAALIPRGGVGSAVAETLFAVLLLRFGVRALLRAWSGHAEEPDPLLDARYLRCGFVTAVSNPFTLAFLATAAHGRIDGMLAAATIFFVAAAWFGLIGLAFCHPPLRALYARHRARAEEILGLVLVAMAVRALVRVVMSVAG